MFDFFTILHDNGLLLLMGQYPDGPLGGVLCTLLVSLLAVLFAFPVGATLRVMRNQKPGVYHGMFAITLQYQ